jgi:hypothetical protein
VWRHMLNPTGTKEKVMLWLASVAGVLLGGFGTIWSLIYIERIDDEIRRVDRLGVGIQLGETHRELARKYGLDTEALRYPQWLTQEVIVILRKRRKRAGYIRVILLATGITMTIGAIIFANLRP